MKFHHFPIAVGLILFLVSIAYGYHCKKLAERMKKSHSTTPVYVIDISGSPVNYVPNEKYIITIKNNPLLASRGRFRDFELIAEQKDPLDTLQTLKYPSAGHFELIDEILTRFSDSCPNTVIQTNTVLKSTVKVVWVAPPPNSGCIAIKATVVTSPDNWYSHEGSLTKVLCEEKSENEDFQPPTVFKCCACDEAKYEIAFQGLWSRNTHPKDFPMDVWTTKFSDIIGASHQLFKSFWEYGGYASEGLKLFAEEGNSSVLENELKERASSDYIRTIIKARELTYPNITGTSYTVFRVDKKNHILSLVSKITPSPDWIVGVSNLELCLSDCTWVESRTLNLYPWDVGTDDGIGYNSPDSPSDAQLIKRIKSNSPNDPNSPFFSQEGEPIKPLAKLHITREKVYTKICEQEDESCATSKWSKWSACSDDCFKNRTRRYLHPDAADNCEEVLIEHKKCSSHKCRSRLKETTTPAKECEGNEEECETKETPTEPTCEDSNCEETSTKVFGDISSGNLQVTPILITEAPEGDVTDCKVTQWSEWSPCNTEEPCTSGYQFQHRQIKTHPFNGGKPCSKKLLRKRVCKVPCTQMTKANTTKIDCVMGPWTNWTPCNATCGSAVQLRVRNVLVYPNEHGRPCPTRKQIKSCNLPTSCTNPSF